MHVLYIMGQNSGGLPHYTAELANAVSSEAEVTVLKPSETSADGIFNDDINIVNCFDPTSISMQNIFDLRLSVFKDIKPILSYRNIKIVEEVDPDIVHDPTDQFPQVEFFSYFYGTYKTTPYVVTSHEVKHGKSNLLLKIPDFIDWVIPDFPKDAAVVHSEDQRSALKRKAKSIESVHTIPHGVYDFFTDYDYAEPDQVSNHALFFGSLIPPKGLRLLVESVPKVVEEIPDFSLTIAGEGNIPDPNGIIDSYSSAITVRNEFIPNDEVGELFHKAQLVVLPYREGWQTGHSGTLSTAFAFGKPVVTTDVGDFQRMVEDSNAGIVVEPEDADALAEGIIEVLSDSAGLEKMSKASAKKADELSWENIAKEHIEMYAKLI